MNFEWTIETTKYTLSAVGLPDMLTEIYWRCTATEGALVSSSYGTAYVTLPATTTEAERIALVQSQNPTTEADLQAQLNLKNNPVYGQGLPWEEQFPVWMVGIFYDPDTLVNYENTVYRCVQGHTSQSGWIPPSVPALWEVKQDPAPGEKEWVAGEAVIVGDKRWYPTLNDSEYECIQAHTTQLGWEPPNVPSLWAEAVV